MDKIFTCKTSNDKSTIKCGRKTAGVISAKNGRFHLYVPLNPYNGISADFSSFNEAISGAQTILAPAFGNAVINTTN